MVVRMQHKIFSKIKIEKHPLSHTLVICGILCRIKRLTHIHIYKRSPLTIQKALLGTFTESLPSDNLIAMIGLGPML
jgi:hypothetical protein